MEFIGNRVHAHSEPYMRQEVNQDTLRVYSDSTYYPHAWLNGEGGESRGFNLAACVFGFAWCFHRKLFQTGLILFMLTWLVPVGAGMLLGDSGLALPVSLVLIAGLHVWLGANANRLYLEESAWQIERIVASDYGNDAFVHALRKTGGTSLMGIATFVASAALLAVL